MRKPNVGPTTNRLPSQHVPPRATTSISRKARKELKLKKAAREQSSTSPGDFFPAATAGGGEGRGVGYIGTPLGGTGGVPKTVLI